MFLSYYENNKETRIARPTTYKLTMVITMVIKYKTLILYLLINNWFKRWLNQK